MRKLNQWQIFALMILATITVITICAVFGKAGFMILYAAFVVGILLFGMWHIAGVWAR